MQNTRGGIRGEMGNTYSFFGTVEIVAIWLIAPRTIASECARVRSFCSYCSYCVVSAVDMVLW